MVVCLINNLRKMASLEQDSKGNLSYEDESDEFLRETEYIDFRNPLVSELAARLTGHLDSEREKACAVFGFVRDNIKFGWTYQFSNMKASDVILSGYGYSVSKSTIFVALLRACKIPARLVFVDISAEILSGYCFLSDDYLDHAFVEVLMDGDWIKTDAYVLDRELFVNAKERLQRENKKVGYGVHAHGTMEWDGTGDAFCQYVDDGHLPNLTVTNFGHKSDVLEFYKTAEGTHNNFDVFLPLAPLFYFTFYIPNARVQLLRDDKDVIFSLIG